MNELDERKIEYKIFRDNIFNNEITVIGTEPLEEGENEYLKKFQLLKIN